MTTFRKPQGVVPFNLKQVEKALKEAGFLLVSQKFDGVRLRVSWVNGKVILTSRTGKPFPALRKAAETLSSSGLCWVFGGYDVEGELIVVGPDGKELPCEETNGILARHEQIDCCQLNFYPCDAIDRSNLQMPFVGRQNLLNSFYAKDLRSAIWPINVKKVLQFHCDKIETVMGLYEEFRVQGAEGIVIADPATPVRAGKVLGKWKMKPVDNREAIVKGLIEAISEEGVPKGMIGSLEVQYEDGSTGRVGAGALTHYERRLFWCNPCMILERVIEVQSMEETGKGGMRHPNFRQFRDHIHNKGQKV